MHFQIEIIVIFTLRLYGLFNIIIINIFKFNFYNKKILKIKYN